jgi:hypothetical protein
MLPTPEQGLGILLAGLGISAVLYFGGKVGWRFINIFGLTFNRPRDKTPEEFAAEREDAKDASRVAGAQLQEAFLRYSEAAIGMVAMVDSPKRPHESVRAWVDLVAMELAACLPKRPGDHFRVAVWADVGDPEAFRLLGSANHNTNDPKMERLSKDGTIGGYAFKSKAGEYLCADITKDRKFKPRSAMPRPYSAIFAARLGERGRAWGVVTIDAPVLGAFGPHELTFVRRFAKLISAGASIALAKYAPGSVPIPESAAAAPRIVAGGGQEALPGGTAGDAGDEARRPQKDAPERD